MSNGTGLTGLYIARLNGGVGGAINAGLVTPSVNGTSLIGAASQYGNNYTYPSPNCGGLLMSRINVFDGDSSLSFLRGPRGRLPGLWHIIQIHSFATGDTFSGAAGSLLDGREFELRICGANNNGWLVFETTDTWD